MAKTKTKPTTKTAPTTVSVRDFIAQVGNDTRRQDATALLKLFEKATGWKARMWGPTIVGFGRYEYVYDSGHSGASCVCGFSPRTANLVIYSGAGAAEKKLLLGALGKHKTSTGGCIYINKLADVNADVLTRLIKTGVASMKKRWPVSGS